jgi:hypothetical protein
MNDPRRLVESTTEDFARELLESARDDQGSTRALKRTLAALGVGVVLPLGVVTAEKALAASGAASTVNKLGVLLVAKWVGVGATVGLAGLGGLHVATTALSAKGPLAAGIVEQPARQQAPTLSRRGSAPAANFTPEVSDPAEPGLAIPAPRPSLESTTPQPRAASKPLIEPPESTNEQASPTAALEDSEASAVPAPTARSARVPPTSANRLLGEVTMLDEARRALQRGEARQALTTLKRYEAEFGGGGLELEATVMRIRALLEVGDRAAADELAQRVLRAAPHSHHASIVRTLLARTPGAR